MACYDPQDDATVRAQANQSNDAKALFLWGSRLYLGIRVETELKKSATGETEKVVIEHPPHKKHADKNAGIGLVREAADQDLHVAKTWLKQLDIVHPKRTTATNGVNNGTRPSSERAVVPNGAVPT